MKWSKLYQGVKDPLIFLTALLIIMMACVMVIKIIGKVMDFVF